MSVYFPDAWAKVEPKLHQASDDTLNEAVAKLGGLVDTEPDDLTQTQLLILSLQFLLSVELADRRRTFDALVADMGEVV